MSRDIDFGGDCVFCLAEANDPDCVKFALELGRELARRVGPSSHDKFIESVTGDSHL